MAALDALQIWETAPEQAYDDLTSLASFICGAPISLISLVGKDKQFFKSARNLQVTETPREQSFCAHTIRDGHTLIVPDAHLDPRFAANPLVTGEPGIRFYAGSPILSAGGDVLGTVCVIDHVPRTLSQEQQQALEALARQASALMQARQLAIENKDLERESEQARVVAQTSRDELQTAIDSARIGAWYYDSARNMVGGDERIAAFFGLNRREAPAELWLAAIHEQDRERVRAEFEASLAGAVYDTRYRVSVGGTVRWLHARAQMNATAGENKRMVGVCEDVTNIEKLAGELRRAQERLALAQEASGTICFDWMIEEDKLTWNRARVLGRPATELATAKSFFECVHEGDRQPLHEVIDKALEGADTFYSEFRMSWPDDSVHWVSTAGRAVRDLNGKVDSLVGVNLDITERKLAEQALLQAQKLAAVGRLASVISHEINNPLEAVTNLLFILRASENLSQEDRDHVDMADRELARVSEITAQTLRFHRTSISPVKVQADELLEELVALYASRLKASDITVKLDLAKGVSFTAFEADIRQVLHNLIGNAFDAMRKGGTLRIRTRCVPDPNTGQSGACITVADDGFGIPAEMRKRVFEAFFTTKGINGSGLGLWISKRIVHKHKGHLFFRSCTGASHGSVFRLWLPNEVALTAAEGWA